jgi:vacuolar-type H+-ATPase subunit H
MPQQSSDDIVRNAREQRRKQIEDCSRRAAKKILGKIPKGSHVSEATLAEWIAGEFEELTR